jgi:hypothetical protein
MIQSNRNERNTERIDRRCLLQALAIASVTGLAGCLGEDNSELEVDDDPGATDDGDDEVEDDYPDENRDIDRSELDLSPENGRGELHESVVISDDKTRGVLLTGDERTEGTSLVGGRVFSADSEITTEVAV